MEHGAVSDKSILFLLDFWYPKQTANSVCVKKIAKELLAQGWTVYVYAYRQNRKHEAHFRDEGINVYFETLDFSRQLLTLARWCESPLKQKALRLSGLLLNRARRFVLLPIYPIASPMMSLRWSRNCKKLIAEKKIKYVVSVMMPEDSVHTGYLIKKKSPEISWSVYYIDAGTNVLPGSNFEKLRKLLQNKAIRWENKILHGADRIIIMKGHESHYNASLDKENAKKLVVRDVPLFDLNSVCEDGEIVSNEKCQRWVYTGSMWGKYYDPHRLCTLFMKYRKLRPAQLHLYGPSNFSEYLSELTNNPTSGIVWHGLVPHEEAVAAQRNADVLVYYKMRRLDSVSGKFFEYIVHKKPIVYFGNTGDINAEHVKKYDLGCTVDVAAEDAHNALKIADFIESCHHKKVEFQKLKEDFYLSLPETTANVFEDLHRKTL